jgi:hypothetical protein
LISPGQPQDNNGGPDRCTSLQNSIDLQDAMATGSRAWPGEAAADQTDIQTIR